MPEYFTSDHFKLLSKWKGDKRDESNPEQDRAYDELKKAYEVTEEWANAVKDQLFSDGHVNIRKRPTNQANNFFPYNWAKIYPSQNAPKQLAYTVGIDADIGFIVKIDTVGLDDSSGVRLQYLKLRGDLNNQSPIVAILPITDGLAMPMADLVQWSVDAIQQFSMSYAEVVEKIGLLSGNEAEKIVGNQSTLTLQPKNVIYYGPPGTGKTYALQQLLRSEYTQVPEALSTKEWRHQMMSEKIATLTWWECAAAALYDLGGKAKVTQIFEHPFILALAIAKNRSKNVRQTLWNALQSHTIETSSTVNAKTRLPPFIFDKTSDSIWQFAGEWEEECAELIVSVDQMNNGLNDKAQAIKRYSFVTFHQSYGYEEFVEGLRPILNDESEGLSYEIRKGAFLHLCERARSEPGHRYAMVIDEINRGNISKIFGELITLIELDKRDLLDGSAPPIEVKLAYSGMLFSVPANVDIVGTMNTADRSLALVDTALRRRFDFVPCMPDTSNVDNAPLRDLVVSFNDLEIDVRLLLEQMNQRIEALYDRDHTIGHAYFTSLHKYPDGQERFEALAQIFRNRIVPLLEEYFFEDWQKIRLVLADNQKSEAACFITVSEDQEGDLANLFGGDHGLDAFATKPRFKLEESAFINPDAYLGIYSTVRS